MKDIVIAVTSLSVTIALIFAATYGAFSFFSPEQTEWCAEHVCPRCAECDCSLFGENERETLSECQLAARNAALDLAADYFSAMGPEKVYSVPQIVEALRSLKVERAPREGL